MSRHLVLFLFICASCLAFGQRPDSMPRVASWNVPYYPPLARQARAEGVVRIKVTTDGETVQKAEAVEGHALLAEAAIKNIRTWHFISGSPAKFTATFTFKLAKVDDTNLKRLEVMYPDAEIRAELPLIVEITSAPPPPLY